MIFAFLLFLSAIFPAAAFDDMPLAVAVTRPTTAPVAVEEMIQRGEDPNAVDDNGMTPLMLAAKHAENPAVIAALIDNGAIIDKRNPYTGQTALFYAAQFNKNPKIPMLLIRKGADPVIKDFHARTIKRVLSFNPALPQDMFDDYFAGDSAASSTVSPASR